MFPNFPKSAPRGYNIFLGTPILNFHTYDDNLCDSQFLINLGNITSLFMVRSERGLELSMIDICMYVCMYLMANVPNWLPMLEW